MTKDLIATFGKSDGGTHNWKYKGLDPNLSAPQIKEACELLTNLDICTQNGVKLFDSVVTAKVVNYKETLIFDPEHETRGVRYDGEPVEEATCEEVRCFEVAEKPENPVTVTAPKPSVLPATPHGHYFKQLTTIEDAEKVAIKVEKESLPQSSNNQLNDQKSDAMPLMKTELSNQDTKEQNRLLQWLHRIRKKNKEGPPETPRE
ncbi:hypothetical protein KQI58_19575 [Enterococcus raffinosus]|uniref:DUF2922 family protein n=1 Tax=Enterococcus raffinosus TaxID=71452 RepID=UPI001C11DC15|nr:hypothetical protein [Enterococcus raffinosus]MBU5363247.1 hypothetical protein [Enterococcus raffinosus]